MLCSMGVIQEAPLKRNGASDTSEVQRSFIEVTHGCEELHRAGMRLRGREHLKLPASCLVHARVSPLFSVR